MNTLAGWAAVGLAIAAASCSDPVSPPDRRSQVVWVADTLRGTPHGMAVRLAMRGDRLDDLYLVAKLEPTVGDLFRFDGVRWTRQIMPDPAIRIFDIQPFQPGVAFAVGGTQADQGVIVTLENGLWTYDDGPWGAPALMAIAGHRTDSLVVAGVGGQLYERNLAPHIRFQGWGSVSLQQYGISVSSSALSRPHSIEPLAPRGFVMTYHDVDAFGNPLTRMLTQNGWWWSQINSVWGHTPRVLMTEPNHLAYVISDTWYVEMHTLDHGSFVSTHINTDGAAVDVDGTSLDDVLVLTTRRLFRMGPGAHVGIPGPWDDNVVLKAVWTDGPHVVVAGRSLTDLMTTIVYRGMRKAW